MKCPYDLSTASGRYWARERGFDVPKMNPGRKPLEFWKLVKKTKTCWNWQGFISRYGYGIYCNDGEHRAHRWAWESVHGAIPDGLVVMHLCDNKKCVRPSHLRVGTQAENRADCVQKNRQARGSKSGRAILNERQVRRILADPRSSTLIAKDYKVEPTTIRKIKCGRNWRHVS